MNSRRLLPVAFLALVALGLSAGFISSSSADDRAGTPAIDRLVQPGEAESSIWPYTSRSKSVEGRTLALNVVVYASPDQLRTALEHRSDVNWTETEGDAAVIEAEREPAPDELSWQGVRGAARYTYVTPDSNATGRWVQSEYQLGTGTYFGTRIHVRAYPSPSGEWTALQAHSEYWDWFRLRHTVTGVEPGGRSVEQDLRGESFVTAIWHSQWSDATGHRLTLDWRSAWPACFSVSGLLVSLLKLSFPRRIQS